MSAYIRTVLADSPVLFWPLNELSGTTAYDLSGNGRHGTYNGSPSLATGSAVPGSKCWNPDRSNDYVQRAHDSALNVGTGDFLIELWYRGTFAHAGTDEFETLFARENDADDGLLSIYTTDTGFGVVGALRCWIGGAVVNGAIAINDGNPRHLWLQRVSGQFQAWINDVLDIDSAKAGSVTPSTTTYGLTVGAKLYSGAPTGLYFLEEPVSHVAFYTTVPSAARRTAHYKAGLYGGVMIG